MTPDQVPAEAARRMATDPVFHMQVHLTVQVVQHHQRQHPADVRVADPDVVREVASLSAACALVIAEHPELLAVAHQVPPWVRDLITPMSADQLRQQGLL